MSEKTSKKQSVQSPNHKPVTRREFLAQGLITGSAMAFLPSIPMLLGRAALAQSSSDSALPPVLGPLSPRMITLDLAGGANVAFANFCAGGPAGQLDFSGLGANPEDYRQAGVSVAEAPQNAAPDTRFGIAMQRSSGMLAGMAAETDAQVQARVDGVLLAAATENDTSENESSAAGYVAKMAQLLGQSSWFPAVGTSSAPSGGRSTAPFDSRVQKLAPLRVSGLQTSELLTSLGRLKSVVGESSARDRFFNFFGRLNSAQMEKFGALGVDEQMRNVLGQNLSRLPAMAAAFAGGEGGSALNFGGASPQLDGAYGAFDQFGRVRQESVPAPIAQGEYENLRLISDLLMRGYTAEGIVEFGGYDYHGQSAQQTYGKDFAIGRVIGKLLKHAHLMQVPLMIYLLTDGGVSASPSQNGPAQTVNGVLRPQWQSDSRPLSAAALLFYHPTRLRSQGILEGPLAQYRQIGRFQCLNSTIGVNLSSRLSSNSPIHLAQVVAANWAALVERRNTVHSLLTQVVNRNDFASATFADQYLAFRKIA
jgi:hypothetical protein